MKKITKYLIITALCVSNIISIFSINAKAAEVEVTQNIYDTQVIPDTYNTGCKGELTPWREYFGLDESATQLYITPANQNIYGTEYENVDFSDVVVSINNADISSMIFRNCKLTCNSNYNVVIGSNTGSIDITFENCAFANTTAASVNATGNVNSVTYDKCVFYNFNTRAALLGNRVNFLNCYFRNSVNSAYFLQNTGEVSDVTIRNCRFDAVRLGEITPISAIQFKEKNTATISNNVIIENVYMTGSKKTFDFAHNQAIENPNFVFNNIQIGDTYEISPLSITATDEVKQAINDAYSSSDSLYVSSVYEENDKTSLIVTNYTGEDRKLLIITNNNSYINNVEACPTFEEGANLTALSDYPFDLEVKLDETCEYMVCYDVTDESNLKQLRFLNNTSNPVTVNIEDSLAVANEVHNSGSLLGPSNNTSNPNPENPEDAGDNSGNIQFEANITSSFEVTIPNSFRLTDVENSLEFTVSGDIAGNKELSVTVGEAVVLKNENNDELTANITIEKDRFTYLDLEKNLASNILINIEKLPAGRFVGELPVYIQIVNANNNLSD